MKPQINVVHWLQLLAAVGLLATILAVRHQVLPQLTNTDGLAKLRAEHQHLSQFDLDAVHAARTTAEQTKPMASPSWVWPKHWIVSALSPGQNSVPRLLQLKSVGSPEWTDFLNTVAMLADSPGTRIVGMDIRSRGTLTEREIAAVEIQFESPMADPQRRMAPAAVGRPGPVGPAMPPAVGAVASRDRPTASADAPATGAAPVPPSPTPGAPGAGSDPFVQPEINQS